IQQQFVLGKDTEELEGIAEKAPVKAGTQKSSKKTAVERSTSARPAKVVKRPKKKNNGGRHG
ncbi:MAG: hypothetical protein ACREQV_07140, partial [Candidatus Binatia bacterium]